jgi:hypothetical protein
MFSSIFKKVNNNNDDVILPASTSRRNFHKNLAIGSSLLMVGGTGTARSTASAKVHHKHMARAVPAPPPKVLSFNMQLTTFC